MLGVWFAETGVPCW